MTVETDVEAALDGAPHAQAVFAALPPSHRQEYLKWIGEAKKPQTRVRRIEGMIARLSGNQAG